MTSCQILVPGAGCSPERVALAEAGFEVTAVDAAPSAVAVQRARFEGLRTRATFIEADSLAWEPDAPFVAIYDQTCPKRAAPIFVAGVCRTTATFTPTGTVGALAYHAADAIKSKYLRNPGPLI